LSEDVDLIVLGSRRNTAATLQDTLSVTRPDERDGTMESVEQTRRFTMSVIERPPIDPDLIARAVAMAGATSDAEAINLALQRFVEQRTVTVDMLVDDGEFLMAPGVPGHVITTQMVEDALADDD
jgi:Arc/MetJ family transcription regulator